MKVSQKLKLMLKSMLSLKCGEVATDKGKLMWDGEEDLKAEDEVFTENEDGEIVPAADGEYVTEDGKTIVVAEGKVAEIKDAEAEVAPETEVDAKAQFSAQVIAMSESYDEKYRKIAAALIAEGEEAYISEAGDDYAIKVSWNAETGEETYIRYAISWDEDGNVIVGESEEVKRAFVPADTDVEMAEDTPEPADEPEAESEASNEEKIAALEDKMAAITEGINKIVDAIAGIESRLEEVEGKLAKVEAPAAEPVDEENVEQSEQHRSRLSYLRK